MKRSYYRVMLKVCGYDMALAYSRTYTFYCKIECVGAVECENRVFRFAAEKSGAFVTGDKDLLGCLCRQSVSRPTRICSIVIQGFFGAFQHGKWLWICRSGIIEIYHPASPPFLISIQFMPFKDSRRQALSG